MAEKALYGVLVQELGKKATIALVGNGATVGSALRAVKLDTAKVDGKITLNGKKANLGDRVKTNDQISFAPDVAGGSR